MDFGAAYPYRRFRGAPAAVVSCAPERYISNKGKERRMSALVLAKRLILAMLYGLLFPTLLGSAQAEAPNATNWPIPPVGEKCDYRLCRSMAYLIRSREPLQ